MTLKKLTTEEAQSRLEWLCGGAEVKLTKLVSDIIDGEWGYLDPIPPEAIELLHEISRVAATVAKHYDVKSDA